jgi:hypothetical protein
LTYNFKFLCSEAPQFYVTYAFCNELEEEEIDSGECIKCKDVIKKAADYTVGMNGLT